MPRIAALTSPVGHFIPPRLDEAGSDTRKGRLFIRKQPLRYNITICCGGVAADRCERAVNVAMAQADALTIAERDR